MSEPHGDENAPDVYYEARVYVNGMLAGKISAHDTNGLTEELYKLERAADRAIEELKTHGEEI